MQFGLGIPKLVSELKSDLGSKSYDVGPHVKLMGNPAVDTYKVLRVWIYHLVDYTICTFFVYTILYLYTSA